jgi:hypothetical protein
MTVIAPTTPSHPGRAFTLIEVIVTFVILAVVLGVVTPRLLNMREDDAERAARQLAGALNAVARRAETSSQPLALVFNDDQRAIEVWSLRRPLGAGRDADLEWANDPFINPVELEDAALARLTVAGVVQPADAWRIDIEPGRPRPTVEAALAPAVDARGPAAPAWTVTLPTYATRAIVRTPGGRVVSGSAAAATAQPVDLDAIGAGETRW